MTDSPKLSTRRQLELMQQLQQLADTRAAREKDLAESLERELSQADQERQTSVDEFVKENSLWRRELENLYSQSKLQAQDKLRKTLNEAELAYDEQRRNLETAQKKKTLEIDRRKKESEWQALAVYDAGKDLPGMALHETRQRLNAHHSRIEGLLRDADTLLAMRKLSNLAESFEFDPVLPSEVEGSEQLTSEVPAESRLHSAIDQAHRGVLEMQAQLLPSLMLESSRWALWWLGAAILCGIIGLPLLGLTWWAPLVVIAAGGALTAVGYWLFMDRVRRESLEQYGLIRVLLERANEWEATAQDIAQTHCDEESEALVAQRDQEVEAAEQQRLSDLSALEEQTKMHLELAEREKQETIDKAEQESTSAQHEADEKYPPQLDNLAAKCKTGLEKIEADYQARITQAQKSYESGWQSMADTWHEGFNRVVAELSEIEESCNQLFPNWQTTEWHDWTRPTQKPPAMQFGSYSLPLSAVKQGLSEDTRLVPQQTELKFPALMNFSEHPSMVITTAGAGRTAAVGVLQSMMLRFLTTIPAGRLRFTIIDPSALGENFATFMHLADFDEQLVGGRILTDSRQIDERLGVLSDHLEKVLQKYLRNEFESLEAYNEQAGEVAEPYHVLVVANFPAGLSDSALRKIKTIAKTGPRCGVYTLMSIDSGAKLPGDFQAEDLLQDSVHLHYANDRLVWNYPLYEKLPLQLDVLPPREKLTELLHHVAQESREASRVEVPFEVVAPKEEDIWSGSTAHELVVPIGRAGAHELQTVRLGRGTSQHLLISGKTGSGKSTLLHAFITNAALHYSPLELELYLVDFKKGVEFKAYATGELPHARVIAVESEREFGVSVLERLDDELRRRGEIFREHGVQDLAGMRKASSEPMPRVVLIIDEFQELFVVDDKLAQDSALLLDRLVRQGRAFGIHVILGSQTLAGAYSLARSTLGQMAVRIALQCSEADAHLILSDDNIAARLLSRPGEAIYNDQNGMVEGNSLFQVVWLSDEQRQVYLAGLREQLPQLGYKEEPAIVFEGNVPADPKGNGSLVAAVASQDTSEVVEPTIWLGSAVRIGPPTNLVLRRQGGNNLLVVGQDEALVLGIFCTAATALVAQRKDQHQSSSPQISVLDGSRPESQYLKTWARVAEALGASVEVNGPQDAKHVISSLSAELKKRTEAPDEVAPKQVLILHDLAQFRDLRMKEDDFGFSKRGTNGDTPALDKQFRELLREGPGVGIHVFVWADSYNSLTRCIDRLTLREIDFRVALQMSPADSTTLIDSPAAGRLGEHRAILYRDDQGTQVKFRPYQAPTEEWLESVKQGLAATGKLAQS